jgi:hypothetical protein
MVRMDKAETYLRSEISDFRSQIKTKSNNKPQTKLKQSSRSQINKSNNKPRSKLKTQSTKLGQGPSTRFLINVLIRLDHLIRNPLPSGDRVHWLQFCKTP